MEHIITQDLGNGYVRLTAAKGYRLLAVKINQVVSEAVVRPTEAGKFKAIL